MKYDYAKEYLVHSYLYYVLSSPIYSDEEFDELCKQLNSNWEKLDSQWKNFIIQQQGPFDGGYKGCDGLEKNFPEEIKRQAKERLALYEELKEQLR